MAKAVIYTKDGKETPIDDLLEVYSCNASGSKKISFNSFHLVKGATMNFIGAKLTVSVRSDEISHISFEK